MENKGFILSQRATILGLLAEGKYITFDIWDVDSDFEKNATIGIDPNDNVSLSDTINLIDNLEKIAKDTLEREVGMMGYVAENIQIDGFYGSTKDSKSIRFLNAVC